MTRYTVQYELPVDNPSQNVRISRSNKELTFYVPVNHTDAHRMNFMDLLAAAELSGLLDLSTTHKNTADPKSLQSKIIKAVKKSEAGV